MIWAKLLIRFITLRLHVITHQIMPLPSLSMIRLSPYRNPPYNIKAKLQTWGYKILIDTISSFINIAAICVLFCIRATLYSVHFVYRQFFVEFVKNI